MEVTLLLPFFCSFCILFLLVGTASSQSAEQFWQPRAPMPTTRTEISAIALGKKIYVAGGFDFSQNQFTALEIYDAEVDSWRIGTPIPEHVDHAGIGVANGKVYIIGGRTNHCWEYDPAGGTWSRKADMLHRRLALWVAELNGKLYAIGGVAGSELIAPIEVYDPDTDTWEESAPLPTPRHHLVVAAVSGKIYAIGGRGPGVDSRLVHEYDPQHDLWLSRSPMPTPRSGMMVAVVNQEIHVIGGEGPLTNAHEIYHPMADTWETAPPMPVARSGLAGGVIDNQIYAIGGHTADETGVRGALNINEVFTVSTPTLVPVEPRGKRFTTFGAVKQLDARHRSTTPPLE